MELIRTAARKFIFWMMDHPPYLLSSMLAFILYANTLDAEFVYDDSRAIITNQDLRSDTSWYQLLVDDFWGTPLRHSGSHKSYRPFTVATFRLNYRFGQLDPFGYHLVNVLLHVVTTSLVVSLSTRLSNGDSIIVWTSSLLFAAHPVHTEAVSGVVGRADLLTTFCFLLCIRSYFTLMDSQCHSRAANTVLFLLWTTGSVLAKEHGLTVLGVCLAYDLVLTSSSTVRDHRNRLGHRSKQSSPMHKQQQDGCPPMLTSAFFQWLATRRRSIRHKATPWTYTRWSLLVITGLILAYFRLWLMDFSTPSFSPSDNPAAHSDNFLTRFLTFSYLTTFNSWLLLCPSTLSFDWSMDSIPLVDRVSDIRNLATLSLYLGLAYLTMCILRRVTLVTPSSRPTTPRVSTPRSTSPANKRTLFDVNGNACSPDDPSVWTGRISPNTAKSMHCSVQNCSSYKLKFRGRPLDPLRPLDLASSSESDLGSAPSDLICGQDRTALMGLLIAVLSFLPATNLLFYVGFVVAERILYLPSVGFCLLVGVGLRRLWSLWSTHCPGRSPTLLLVCCLTILFGLCAKTIRRNEDWKNEERLYSSGIPVNPAKAYSNLGNVYAQKRLTDKAVWAYRAALDHRPNMADTHYNYGILLQERGDLKGAALAYENAIKCRPRMALAYLNMGIVLTSMQRYKEAEQRYLTCSELSVEGLKDPRAHESAKLSCLYNLGRLFADQNRYPEAIEAYRLAIQRLRPFYQAHSLYNALGDALAKTGSLEEAEDAFKKSLAAKPDHVPAHLTYGHLLAKTNRRPEALRYFERACVLSPSDSVVWQHLGQFHSDSGHFQKAVQAYKEAWRLAQSDFDATFGLANAYRNLGEPHLAEEYYEKAAYLRPTSANAHMNFGAILHMNKKWDRAEKEYLLALKLNPGDELTKENLRKLRKSMSKR